MPHRRDAVDVALRESTRLVRGRGGFATRSFDTGPGTRETSRKRATSTACLRLEGELAGLDLCKKSLADFLDGRRRQFPRYYFTSEAYLLDILSNGSVPEKVMVHTSKIYLSTTVTRSEEERTA